MQTFDNLTRLAKIHHFRKLAGVALEAYGLPEVRLKFLRLAGNAVYRVYVQGNATPPSDDYPFEPNQYVLRIHSNREQPTDAIRLEMQWLKAIREDTGLPVPEPVPNRTGDLLTRVSTPGIPDVRDCTLLRWMKGRYVTKQLGPQHFSSQGRLMAQLHNHAAKWRVPSGLSKRRFDWKGLFRDNSGAKIPASEAWPLLDSRCREPYERVAQKTKALMTKLGRSSDVFGLIHADCGNDANVLYWKGEPRPIDFDGSGFGYYAYDLAIALEHVWQREEHTQYRQALLEGYHEFRQLSKPELSSLDLLLAAFYVYMGLWETAVIHTSPHAKWARERVWQKKGLKFIRKHLAG